MNESIDYLHEVFDAFGSIHARRIFGGWGTYHDDLMFGLYAAGRLYLKTDAHNVAQFVAVGCEPFTYNQRGKVVKLSYWSAPEAVLDDREQAVFWARVAFDAALRAHAAKMKLKTKAK
jgi:DNA transformation protein and related proteins